MVGCDCCSAPAVLNQPSKINNQTPMKIALGVTGGIAAYKAAEIVRLLQDRGIRVQVVMTRAAQEFVRPLTFAALSGEKVITGMFAPGMLAQGQGEEQAANIDSAIEHIAVAQSIDALLVVPATADVLAHFAQGIAGDFLTPLSPPRARAVGGRPGHECEHVESSRDAGES